MLDLNRADTCVLLYNNVVTFMKQLIDDAYGGAEMLTKNIGRISNEYRKNRQLDDDVLVVSKLYQDGHPIQHVELAQSVNIAKRKRSQ
jgi:hypothetical protein